MKMALIVPRLTKDIDANIAIIDELISEACANNASFVLLPETVLTGLINNDVYDHDIKLSVSLDSQTIMNFCDKANKNNIWLCFGFFENYNGCIYDSAVLINSNGEIVIHYRRINPQWRDPGLQLYQYSEGSEVKYADTPLGKTVIVICGDLFDDEVIAKINHINPDFVLYPFARCFFDEVENVQKEWDETEEKAYVDQAQLTGATVVMSNYIGAADINDTSFGGAFAVNANGKILASLPLCQEGILYFDYNTR